MEKVFEKKSPQVAPGLRLYKMRARKNIQWIIIECTLIL